MSTTRKLVVRGLNFRTGSVRRYLLVRIIDDERVVILKRSDNLATIRGHQRRANDYRRGSIIIDAHTNTEITR